MLQQSDMSYAPRADVGFIPKPVAPAVLPISNIAQTLHFIGGFAAGWEPRLWWLLVPYQLSQYFLNVRFNLFEGRYEEGNTWAHTMFKLGQLAAGTLLYQFVHWVF